MAEKKVGVLIKEARTQAGLTQEKLAQKAGEGLTAADISKCELGKADLTTAQLKKIAVACGVTQTSLVNAPKNLGPAKSAAAKTASAKTSGAGKTETKKTASKTTEAKTSAKTSAKTTTAKPKTTAAKTTAAKPKTTAAKPKTTTPAGANTSMKVTATEKKLVEAYRSAGSDEKKIALKVLKGEYGDKVTSLLNLAGGGVAGAATDGISDAIGSLLSGLLGGK